MGFSLSDLNPVKATKKAFKSVARKIKKGASSLWGGIKKNILKPIGKLYSATFGKLGPLGMIAASLILPGLGSMIAAGWAAAAGSIGGAIGAGMTAVSTGIASAASAVSGAYGAVTSTISEALTTVGGSISEGASSMWQAGSEWLAETAPELHSTISDAGSWITEKATDISNSVKSMGGESQSAFNIQADAGSITGGTPGELTGSAGSGFNISPESGSLLGDIPADQSIAAFQAGEVNILPTVGEVPPTSEFNLGSDPTAQVYDPTGGASFGEVPEESLASKAKDAALKAAKSLLAPESGAFAMPEITTPDTGIDLYDTDRFSIGGRGAFGGQFLTEQQRAFFQQHSAALSQQG